MVVSFEYRVGSKTRAVEFLEKCKMYEREHQLKEKVIGDA